MEKQKERFESRDGHSASIEHGQSERYDHQRKLTGGQNSVSMTRRDRLYTVVNRGLCSIHTGFYQLNRHDHSWKLTGDQNLLSMTRRRKVGIAINASS
jgi:hypothetical protein